MVTSEINNQDSLNVSQFAKYTELSQYAKSLISEINKTLHKSQEFVKENFKHIKSREESPIIVKNSPISSNTNKNSNNITVHITQNNHTHYNGNSSEISGEGQQRRENLTLQTESNLTDPNKY